MDVSRWKYVFAAIIVNLCIGAVYSLSIIISTFEKELVWNRIETTPAFTIALLTFALSMIPAGKLQDEKGPRITVSIGGFLLSLGMILSSYTNSLLWLYVNYGLLVGLGIGFAYGAPIATCNKWFPDKRGLATGLVVFGFGGGAIIFAPLWSFLIDTYGWRQTFILTGIIFMALTLSSAQILRNPPADYKPRGRTRIAAVSSAAKANFKPAEMFRTKQFPLLWLSYWFGTATGLMTIGQAKQVAMELAGMIDSQASMIVSALGGSNALGRIFWGSLGDKIGREKTLTINFLTCLTALLIISCLFFIQPLFVISIMMIGLCFGGFLALYPAITSDYYGSKNLGVNYGIMFTAYGAGSILGPIMASYSRDFYGSYLPAFHVSAMLAALAMLLTFPLIPRSNIKNAS
jgi:OFA family oxalate/formate antiporter-like MFS transporter